MSFHDFVHDLEGSWEGVCENLVLLARVGSTNSLARRIANECLEECGRLYPALVVAYEQVAGRGRQGNRWASPAGRGLYATLLRPVAEPEFLQTLPLLAAVGLCRGLNRHLGGAACRLKWPNDLLVEGRKIGGLLIESLSLGDGTVTALIGFGINHDQGLEELPGPNATSLRVAAGSPPGLGELARDLVRALKGELDHAGDQAYAVAQYEDLSLHRPGDRLRCRLAEEEVEGTFLGFDSRGFLRLETAGRERLLPAGEVLRP